MNIDLVERQRRATGDMACFFQRRAAGLQGITPIQAFIAKANKSSLRHVCLDACPPAPPLHQAPMLAHAVQLHQKQRLHPRPTSARRRRTAAHGKHPKEGRREFSQNLLSFAVCQNFLTAFSCFVGHPTIFFPFFFGSDQDELA